MPEITRALETTRKNEIEHKLREAIVYKLWQYPGCSVVLMTSSDDLTKYYLFIMEDEIDAEGLYRSGELVAQILNHNNIPILMLRESSIGGRMYINFFPRGLGKKRDPLEVEATFNLDKGAFYLDSPDAKRYFELIPESSKIRIKVGGNPFDLDLWSGLLNYAGKTEDIGLDIE